MRLFLLSCFTVLFALPVCAQTTVAVVDVDRVLAEAKTAKALNTKRASARESFLSDLSKEEQSLQSEAKALFEKRKDLGEEEFMKAQKDYEGKLLEVRKRTQKKKRDFEEASAKALKILKDQVSGAVKVVANEKGYALVISNRNVIAGSNDLDITEATIERMDKDAKTIPFSVK